MSIPSKINVLFMASEADPLIKVGGLGDVAGSLPQALRRIAPKSNAGSPMLDVRLVIPYHPMISRTLYPASLVAEYNIPGKYGLTPTKAYAIELDGLPVYMIDGPPIAHESGVYSADLETDAYKYVYFSIASLELARRLDWKLDILHANDWHTAAAVYSLAMNRPIDPFFKYTASMLTVHNLPYMGAMTGSALDAFELPPAHNTSLPAWAGDMALPLGLLTADAIVAVSPGYSKEILTVEFGSGLQTFLRTQSQKISGILNGLDTARWDPSVDRDLPANFSSDNLQNRHTNKSSLQKELGLEVNPNTPLFAMVTRMDPQKGVDLAIDALRILLQSASVDTVPFQAVFLGTGNPTLEQAAHRLEQDFPDKIRAKIMYSEKLSRHIYAGADGLLMPSRYEPCGLSQMIAMRYGCVPIARSTGGLSDTIHDPSDTDESTGFLFKPALPEAVADAILRAVNLFTLDPDGWQSMQIRGMRQDFSWDRSAIQYYEQYKQLLEHRMDH